MVTLPLFAKPDLTYREEVDKRIVQRLEWVKDEAAFDYLVEIQREERGNWVESVNKITENNYIEMSLPHGSYRYRVTPSDYLGRRQRPPEWARLAVRQIFQPEVDKFSPDIFFLDNEKESNGYVLQLEGKNFLQESIVLLRSARGVELRGEDYRVNSDGTSARVEFEISKLSEGLYDIIVENPGALRAVLRNFRVSTSSLVGKGTEGLPPAPLRFYLAEGYSPLFAFPSVFNDFFEQDFFSVGVVVRFGWIAFYPFGTQLGFEISPSYHYLSAPVNDSNYSVYEISSNIIDCRLNVVWGIPFTRRFVTYIRAGGGITVLANIHLQDDRLSSPQRSGWIPVLGAGLSFSYYFYKNFFIDAGADFLNLLSVDSPPPRYIMPSLTLGFKF
jgi:hypothetical protein